MTKRGGIDLSQNHNCSERCNDKRSVIVHRNYGIIYSNESKNSTSNTKKLKHEISEMAQRSLKPETPDQVNSAVNPKT